MQTRPNLTRTIPVLAVLILLGAAILAAPRLADPIWPDEWYSLSHAGAGSLGPVTPIETWSHIQQGDPWAPPAYFWMLSGWGALVGWGEVATHYLSLLLGLVATALTVRLGRDLGSDRTGLLAGLLLAASAFFINYLHDLRPYTLLTALAAFTVLAYWRISRGNNSIGLSAAFALGAAGLLYTHYLSAAILGGLALYHLAALPKNRAWFRVPVLMGISVLIFLPWLGTSLGAASELAVVTNRAAMGQGTPRVLASMLGYFTNGMSALWLLIGWAAWRARDDRSRFVWFTAGTGLLLLLIADIVMRGALLVELRYTLAIWPLLAVLTATGLHELEKTPVPVGLIVLLWAGLGIYRTFDADSQADIHLPIWHQPWHELVESVEPLAREGDTLLVLLPQWDEPPLHVETAGWYFEGTGVDAVVIGSDDDLLDADYVESIADAIDGAERFFITQDSTRPQYRLDWLQESALPALGAASCGPVEAVEPVEMWLYSAPLDRPANVVFEGEDAIHIYDISPKPAIRDGQINTVLRIEHGPDLPPYRYSLGVQLLDEAGALARQFDAGVPLEEATCQLIRWDAADLPPGSYTLTVVVYAWETGERLGEPVPLWEIE